MSAGLLLTGCSESAAAPRDGVLVQDLVGDEAGAVDIPETRVGEYVTMRAVVERILAPGAFTVRAADARTEQPLLVLAHREGAEPGEVLQLGGLLEVFEYREYADDYQLGNADQYATYTGQKALVADLVDSDVALDEDLPEET